MRGRVAKIVRGEMKTNSSASGVAYDPAPYGVAVTGAPLFVQKAQLFPGCVFVVGADTLRRILDPKYYGGREGLVAALTELRVLGCAFVVGGRARADGTFDTAEAAVAGAAVPDALKAMFTVISESEFRLDLSSTELRALDDARPARSESDGAGIPPPLVDGRVSQLCRPSGPAG